MFFTLSKNKIIILAAFYLSSASTLNLVKSKKLLFLKELNEVQMMIGVTDWVENIEGKGENSGYHNFLLFPQCFQKASFPGLLTLDCVVKSSVFE